MSDKPPAPIAFGADYFVHPARLPKNVPGPFYSLGTLAADGTWHGECLSCASPESEAPALLARLDDTNADTYFIRQPETAEEIDRACRAAEVCCVSAIRYAGKDPAIIRRLGAEHCDFEVSAAGEVQLRSPKKSRRWWQF